MPKDNTVKVNTGDWNDLLKASAKQDPVFKKIKVKDLRPLPAVVAKAQNAVSIDKGQSEIEKGKPTWLAVENVKDYVKEPQPEELEVAYASTFEQAKNWAKKLNS